MFSSLRLCRLSGRELALAPAWRARSFATRSATVSSAFGTTTSCCSWAYVVFIVDTERSTRVTAVFFTREDHGPSSESYGRVPEPNCSSRTSRPSLSSYYGPKYDGKICQTCATDIDTLYYDAGRDRDSQSKRFPSAYQVEKAARPPSPPPSFGGRPQEEYNFWQVPW